MINKHRLFVLSLLFLLPLSLLYSTQITSGAAYGLTLWYKTVVPCLFPFMILTSLLSEHLHRGGRFFAMLCGFVCGYPLGAKTAADLYQKGSISKDEMQLIACFCNLPSPMFLIGYAKLSFFVFFIYLSSILFLAIGYVIIFFRGNLKIDAKKEASKSLETSSFESIAFGCCRVLLAIGIYMIIFSIFSSVLIQSSIFPAKITLTLTALLEITTGTHAVSLARLSIFSTLQAKTAVCVFGGFCGMAQTKSVMQNTPFSLTIYFLAKLFHSLVLLLILQIQQLF